MPLNFDSLLHSNRWPEFFVKRTPAPVAPCPPLLAVGPFLHGTLYNSHHSSSVLFSILSFRVPSCQAWYHVIFHWLDKASASVMVSLSFEPGQVLWHREFGGTDAAKIPRPDWKMPKAHPVLCLRTLGAGPRQLSEKSSHPRGCSAMKRPQSAGTLRNCGPGVFPAQQEDEPVKKRLTIWL